ncbi:MAG TPA: deoxyribodipyrimidine photo-lyase, partial [Candidatus Berkiella sp.]|nr:deoxyribodipyrimidine photo-lyase [Candidatus Berkiella sp.]
IDDNTPHPWQAGEASRWWLHQSLLSLESDLAKKYQAPLLIYQGSPLSILQTLCQQTQAEHVYWDRCYEPYAIKRDTQIKTVLTKQNINVKSFNCALLQEPWEALNKTKQPFRVFTPFWRNLQKMPVRDILPLPKKFGSFAYSSDLTITDCVPLPTIHWYEEMATLWQPGESGAKNHLAHFLKNALDNYKTDRNRPDLKQTSRLSPHLHFGEISPVQIWHATHSCQAPQSEQSCFLSEIAWREFSYHLLYHFPALPSSPFKTPFKNFPWEKSKALLKHWQQGQTGYPIVDAGMRELWHTGWMHNRVRMVVASFLIKHLLQPWQDGEKWFWNTLVDADLANNAASWQWVAGSGADAAPYFRIFNPVVQGEKFDPNGDYVKKWVPEIARLPIQYLHTPWEAPDDILAKARVQLGKTYPHPIVEHAKARERALAAYQTIRQSP